MNKKQDQSYGVIPFVIKNHKKYFLLIHQQKGHWGFPKGHSQEDENKFETAVRELAEEVGVNQVRLFQNNAFQEKYIFEENGTQIHKIVEYFLGEVLQQNISVQDEEVQDYAWVTEDEAMQLLTFSEVKKVFKEALNWFKTNYK